MDAVMIGRTGFFREELTEAASEEEVVVISAVVAEDLEAGGLQEIGE